MPKGSTSFCLLENRQAPSNIRAACSLLLRHPGESLKRLGLPSTSPVVHTGSPRLRHSRAQPHACPRLEGAPTTQMSQPVSFTAFPRPAQGERTAKELGNSCQMGQPRQRMSHNRALFNRGGEWGGKGFSFLWESKRCWQSPIISFQEPSA